MKKIIIVLTSTVLPVTTLVLIATASFFVWSFVTAEDEVLARLKGGRCYSLSKWAIMEGERGVSIFNDEDFDCSYAVTCVPLQESDFIHGSVVTEEALQRRIEISRKSMPLVCDVCLHRHAYFRIVMQAYRALSAENL
ncbi:MAG: hypothetical protein FWE05_11620 [Defluviitaleaceae bacterium]|nr:hypothetical protein [Defluviitaleaceae bacterium]